MILVGEIFSYDIGEEEIIFHISSDNGPIACWTYPTYAYDIRRFAHNKNKIKITGEIMTISTYRNYPALDVLFKVSKIESLYTDKENEFILTGALY